MPLPVHRISIPNPFFEGRNSVYVVAKDPITLIDSGVATDKAFAALEQGLKDLKLAVSDVKRVVLTHKHIDHIGNAWRFQEAENAEILIHQSECKSVREVDPSGGRFRTLVDKKLAEWSVPRQVWPGRKHDTMPLWRLQSAEPTPLDDGDCLAFDGGELRVIHTPGHTQGSICFYQQGSLFSGDHVLRDISPNIGGGDLRSEGALGQFLTSLKTIAKIPDDTKVYPGHGEPFHDVRRRCEQLVEHHDQRLATIRAAMAQPKTVFELATALFGTLEGIHLVLGCAEANAHLELLAESGHVEYDGQRWTGK